MKLTMTDLIASLDRVTVLSKNIGKSKEFRRILDIIERLRTEELNKHKWNRKSSMSILDALEYEILTTRKY